MTKEKTFRLLSKKISTQRAVIGIIGIGTIGQIIARRCAAVGFQTIGFDIDSAKIAQLNQHAIGKLSATNDFSVIATCDVIIICVPTPVTDKKLPDMRFVRQAVASIARFAGSVHVVILESSVSVGATRNSVARILAKKKNTTWFIGYSPERIDPGNSKHTFTTTPKVISGIDTQSLTLTKRLYSRLVKKVIVATSLEAAELTKLFENTFRMVNISLVHELASFTTKAGLDIWEIIALAATKPFGFLPHYPSVGIGGHCIPVDPYYLLDDARRQKIALPVIKHALLQNEKRPEDIADSIEKIIPGKKPKRHIVLVGITYKKNIADIRQSAAIQLWQCLNRRGWYISYHDPFISSVGINKSVNLTKKLLESVDGIVLTTNHDSIDYTLFEKLTIPIIDTTGHLRHIQNPNIIHL